MNFELADKLNTLLGRNELDKAIALAESALAAIPTTDFHQILGKNVMHLSEALGNYIEAFCQSTTTVLSKKKQGFLTAIFGKAENHTPAAFYAEMNGFTINYDRWFIDLFSYDYFDAASWDWLSDFYDSSDNDFTITGLEEIQHVFRDVHENERFEEPYINKSYEVCELIVILRLQALFRATYQQGLKANKHWAKTPMFVTAHDYELIYKVN